MAVERDLCGRLVPLLLQFLWFFGKGLSGLRSWPSGTGWQRPWGSVYKFRGLANWGVLCAGKAAGAVDSGLVRVAGTRIRPAALLFIGVSGL